MPEPAEKPHFSGNHYQLLTYAPNYTEAAAATYVQMYVPMVVITGYCANLTRSIRTLKPWPGGLRSYLRQPVIASPVIQQTKIEETAVCRSSILCLLDDWGGDHWLPQIGLQPPGHGFSVFTDLVRLAQYPVITTICH